MYKNNSRNSSEIKDSRQLQLYRKMKDLSTAGGYYSYTYRCASCKITDDKTTYADEKIIHIQSWKETY